MQTNNPEMSKLDTITIKGFKSINSIENLMLGSVNVVIGPNGSGKSNFIEVFSFLHAIREGRLQEYVVKSGGANRILHFGSKITSQIELGISFDEGVNQYSIELTATEDDRLYPIDEVVGYWNKTKYATPMNNRLTSKGGEAGINDIEYNRVADYVRNHLNNWRIYHFHDTGVSSPMKRTSDINDNRYLRPDGANIASFLYYLRQRHETSYTQIRRTIQLVAPFFDDFLLEPQRLNPEKIRLEWKHKNSDFYFDVSSFSDGTLRFIALATLLLQPPRYRPSIIIIDEPELGLHPYAIAILASIIQEVSFQTQVIVSTQSPLLLDQFMPEDILVANRVHSSTEFTRLNSTELESWMEDYSLGQLWEKNEIGGRPAME